MKQSLDITEKAKLDLLQGKESGLDYFFNRYYSLLTCFAIRLIDNELVAEEIVSDSFIKLWKKRGSLNKQGSIKSYLYTTVKNSCIDYIRKKHRDHSCFRNVIDLFPLSEEKILSSIIRSETLHQIYSGVEKLSPKSGLVFKMFVDGSNDQEIADKLNISIHTVRNQKIRASKLLRKSFLES
jgi:RNA polymerase sigma-70 factor (ECF subfamily)